MNFVEKSIYDLVKNNPKIRVGLRNTYQFAFDLLPQLKTWHKGDLICHENYFLGFHDIEPFNLDNKLALANKLNFDLIMPEPEQSVDVGYFSTNLKDFNKIGESFAWNYHKGCRLQWVQNVELIYNTSRGQKLVSRIFNIENGTERYLDSPIDSVSPDGKMATSFSYERLNEFMPGYGYKYKDEGLIDELAPSSTGLFLIDLKSNRRELVISIKELTSLEFEHSFEDYAHFVTHSLFSPDSRFVAFFHRFCSKSDIRKRQTRLIVFDLNTKKFFVAPTSGMVSHYTWGKDGIVAYCSIEGKDGHYIFKNPEMTEYVRMSHPNSDGHQHFIPGTSYFVTDTYPNRRRMAELFLVNYYKNKSYQIGSFYSPKKFQTVDVEKHIACDLHPRCDREGNIICFDSAHKGVRSLNFLKFDKTKL